MSEFSETMALVFCPDGSDPAEMAKAGLLIMGISPHGVGLFGSTLAANMPLAAAAWAIATAVTQVASLPPGHRIKLAEYAQAFVELAADGASANEADARLGGIFHFAVMDVEKAREIIEKLGGRDPRRN